MEALNTVIENITRILPEDSCQLWFSLGGEPFRLLHSKGGEAESPPLGIPSETEGAIEERSDGEVLETWFTYPNRGCLVFRRFRPVSLTELDRSRLFITVYPYYAELMIERQQYIMLKMAESTRAITSILELDDLLMQILNNAMAVIPSTDMGVLWMYDEKLGALTARTSVGQLSEGTRLMRMRIGEGIIGMTYQDGKPRLYTNQQDILKDSASISEQNMAYLMGSYNFTNTRSIISVPIAVEGQTECVLIVYQNGAYPLLTEYDLKLLLGFADQVSIAITNARLFQNVSRQNRTLVKRDEIHATLMKLTLQNKGADFIVSELGRMIGLPIVFVDLLEAEYYPKRQRWRNRFQIDELEKRFGSIRSPLYDTLESDGGKQLHYVYPIVAMNACLGFLLVELQTELTTIGQLVLEQGSAVLALEMVRKQSLSDFYYKKTNELFNELLLQKDAGILRKKGEELGLQDGQLLTVVILELASVTDMQLMNIQVHRLVGTAKRKLGHRAPVVFGFRNKVTLLMELPASGAPGDALEACRRMIQEWGKAGGSALRGGAGSGYVGLTAVAKSYNEADKALSYMASKHRTGLLSYSEIGINRLFIHQPEEELHTFIYEVFGPLRSQEGSRLEETLLAYMACNRAAGQTAERLHIHINTLYQRLRKIEELLGLSFDEPEHMLKLQLACYLRS
ncbi:Purine catabolism regulatory protein [Paenibacillus konkukensis]|uniref:Purine catabolism regulatory protein n=1 Tax=Paenibacillus konkukensis TaxID=2020716 RepID=A0ABY4RLS9_9BACL|nr:Purine catabolism regulatory protein [Paenibacillus konkukensis]